MPRRAAPDPSEPSTREKLVRAAIHAFMQKGYAATSIDEICAAAGTTKGGFFHHFPDKEGIALASLDAFFQGLSRRTQEGDYRKNPDPLARIDGYLAEVATVTESALAGGSGCLIASITQELSSTHPAVRERCKEIFETWASWLERDLREAKERYAPRAEVDVAALAQHFVAVLEGAQILARARREPRLLRDHIGHYRAYLMAALDIRERRRR